MKIKSLGLVHGTESTLSMKELIDIVSQGSPELWKIFYPRIYRDTDRYISPKIPAAAMAASVDYAMIPGGLEKSRPNHMVFCAADKIAEFNVPILYIAPELLNAAMASTPPENTKWADMKLPYEGAILMFPRGTFNDDSGNTYDFVGYARHKPQDLIGSRFLVEPEFSNADAFIVFTTATQGSGFILEIAINASENPYIDVGETTTLIPRTEFELSLNASETEVAEKLMNLVFKLALALEARPKLLTEGVRSGQHKKHQHLEIWTPNIVGKDYQYKRTTEHQGTHASPRIHWRRGHFRRQQIGPRIKDHYQHKTIWIEPVIVGA